MKVWIARDGNGVLAKFETRPHFRASENKNDCFFYDDSESGWGEELDPDLFPEILAGECYEAEIVLKEKV